MFDSIYKRKSRFKHTLFLDQSAPSIEIRIFMTTSFRTFLAMSSIAFSRLRGLFISHFSLLQIGKYDQKMFLTVSRDLSTDI